MLLLDDKISEIDRSCKKHRVKELYLFGSALGDEFGQQSDIDLAVVFSRTGIAGSFDQYFDFKSEMEQLLGRSVDLVCVSSIRNRYFRQELEATKKLIYAA